MRPALLLFLALSVATPAVVVPAVAAAAELCPSLPARAPLPRDAVPAPLTFTGWAAATAAVDAKLAQADKKSVGLVFVGDSITASWDPPIFEKFFGPMSPLLLGVGGDRTEGMLYRLAHSELSGLNPKLVVVLAGTNNTAGGSAPENTALGVAEIVRLIHARLPHSKILILALLPRGTDPSDRLRQVNNQVNALVSKCADNRTVFYVDESAKLLNPAGQLTSQMSFDMLHLTPDGYYKLAEGLEPDIERVIGK